MSEFNRSQYEEDKIFREAKNGYGFSEIPQTGDGIFCEGCCCVHKRPTKMYHSQSVLITPVCKFAMVKFYNPEEEE